MECPICGGPAEDMPNTIDGKSIRCPSCGDYDISGTVYDTGNAAKARTGATP
jgi:rRNA maturation protein Nop10